MTQENIPNTQERLPNNIPPEKITIEQNTEKIRVGDIVIESLHFTAVDLADIVVGLLSQQSIKEYLEIYKKKNILNNNYYG